MADTKYNVGVIGYGMSAKVFHIPLILVTPSFNLHSIVQRTPKPNDDASKDHPEAKIYNSADAIFADSSIDIIVITTTPETHFPFAKAALQAVSKQSGKFICVYQNRRWDSDFLTVKKLIGDGTLGRIVEFETHFDRYKGEKPTTWKGTLTMDNAGGVIYDLGTHLIDQAFYLFGLPKTVTAIFANQRADGSVEPDSITVLLGYGEKGPLVTAKAGVICVEEEQLRYWVRGSQGSFKKYHLDVQEDQLKAGLKPGDANFGVESEDRSGRLVVFENGNPKGSTIKNVTPETYATLYKGFADAIGSGSEDAVPVKASEARDVLRIIEAARESAKSGKTIEL
ncbi:hypothetical protein EYC84_007602 [Monilinia fructicola]|uniref:Gfo/Idh/MocA-like oxidoreductase N-terminal domain-containing protein n=1 Tax=Monilinia fructicola TaxID=38448 RepID=A0A5M9JNJ1_MONFR|nr:hypothetical protein EYC84_007602 [Monilinia fructicola]